MTIKKFLLSAAILLTCSGLISAGGYENNEIQEMYSSWQFTEYYDLIYNGAPIDTIEAYYETLLQWIDSTYYSQEARLIGKARGAMILGKHLVQEDYCRDKDRADRYLTESLSYLGQISSPRFPVESLLVEAEIYGAYYLMDQKRNLFTYGVKSNKVTQDIWKRDKRNPRSIILKCNQLIYTPGIFGGDVKEAKRLLLEVAEYDLLPVDLFTVYSCLGIIESKKNRKQQARDYYRKAAAIYPDNSYVRMLLSELD